ncbi:Ribose transport system permease protein RbsC [uncultured spirochete]|jgi:ribose transport system permease protein|uniref:Ribose transport system permease protein RbsC n=1 Tax=uncultured spirochete TaxID=156406 RepID=A0A3P3XQA8_9SPIR|nr:Ribose transport system permease protein RbsC [uncultured spirochete]
MTHDSTMKRLSGKLGFLKGKGVLFAVIVLCVFLSICSPNFLTVGNLMIVLRQSSYIMIIAFGMTMVIGMGDIDLSVSAIAALSGIIAAKMLVAGSSTFLSCVTALAFGFTLGFFNGFLISVLGMTAFIATLGTMSICRGVAMLITRGIPIFGLQFPSFQFLSQGFISIVPFPVVLSIVMLACAAFLIKKTALGRYILSIGSNVEAARLVGINIKYVRVLVFSICGLLSALAGLLLTSRLEAASPVAGDGYEMDVIAATVIGGTSLVGGKAKMSGTFIGALVMGIVRNGLTLLSINVFWHRVVLGAIILISVEIDILSQRKKD